MPGGIFGIEIAKTALFSNQRGIDVTGQNIANVNNEDYHKQRVVLEATSPLFPLGFPGGTGARQIGTGVDVKMIERIRDAFLERRVREETEELGKFDTAFDYLHQVELIYNEPSENSLRARADAFWSSLQDLANNPEDIAVRAAVRESALGLAEIISQEAAEFLRLGGKTLNTSLNQDIEGIVTDLNGAAKELALLNKQIQVQEAAGHNPNDLLDKRDGIVKDISEFIDVSVSDQADGNFLVTIGGVTLAQGVTATEFETKVKSDGTLGIFIKGTSSEVNPMNGQLKALYNFRDHQLQEHVDGLSDFAITLVEKFNDIHKNGFGLDGGTNVDFFKRFDTQASGVYKITGNTFVRHTDLALNGGLYGKVKVFDVSSSLNGSSNFNSALDGNLSTAGIQSAGTLTLNDINQTDLNSDGTIDAGDTTTDMTIAYDISDSLESIVNRINLNVFPNTTANSNRTGAIAKIVDGKLVVNGVYKMTDTGNLMDKLGMTPEAENFESTSLHTTTYPTAVLRVGRGQILIDKYNVSYDGNVDTVKDIVDRINNLRIGIVAEINAQNRLVIRGTAATDFKISELSDSGNLMERFGVLKAGTTFESTFPILDSGTDVSSANVAIDTGKNNINKGRGGQGYLSINGVDIVSNTTVDSPPGLTNDVIYDATATHSLEQIRSLINAAATANPTLMSGVVASITDDNRLIVTGVTSWRDTGDLSQVLRIVPRSQIYMTGDTTSETYIAGVKERPPLENFAFSMDVSTEIKNDLRKIASAGGIDMDSDGVANLSLGPGNGDNMLKLAALKDAQILDNNSATMDQFFGGLISTLGVEVRLAETNRETQLDVINNVELLNKSISGVSLDEEMINLMKFQRGFQAAAKFLSTTNSMIDVLLGMGA